MSDELLDDDQVRADHRAAVTFLVVVIAALGSLALGIWLGAQAVEIPPPELELPTATTTPAPYCDTSTGDLVIPGTGIQQAHPDCEQPPLRHAPPGTKPNVGPTGEPTG